MPAVILKPELPVTAYRLRCVFDVDPFPPERHLEKMTTRAGQCFIRDMEKQGFTYLGQGLERTGPRAGFTPRYVESRAQQKDRPVQDFVFTLPQPDALIDAPCWRYWLTGLFSRRRIVSEHEVIEA